jgi:thiosulfate/3-mercaptopyruvate sulfurtransferase
MALNCNRLPGLFANRSPHFRRLKQTRAISLQSYIVTPKDLADALAKNIHTNISTAPRVIPLCAAWFLPNDPYGRTGRQAFKEKRIPSARFFDLDAVKDHDSPFPHMLPTAEGFAKAMQELGIKRDDTLVVYDTRELGLFSAPRVGWTLRVFGHPGVHVLNNFRLWVDHGYPTESGEITSPVERASDYPVPNVSSGMVAHFAEMKDIAKDHGKEGAEGIQILDARSKGRWAGTEPEPRPGLSSGHIPGSISLPLSAILDAKTGALLPKENLTHVFESKGIDPQKPIISSCGTGVTAAVIDAALGEAGFGSAEDRRIYDGSWTSVFTSREHIYAG